MAVVISASKDLVFIYFNNKKIPKCIFFYKDYIIFVDLHYKILTPSP